MRKHTGRNGSQKRELLGRSGGLTWNYTHPKNSYYMCQARPWGQEIDVTESRPSLWGASNLIEERCIEEKDTHIYILYILYYIFKLQTWKVPCKRRKDLGFFTCIHGHKPFSQLPAPSPLRFFSNAGLSLWSKQRWLFLRKGNHKVSSNLCTHQTPLLGCKCWCQEWFHNQGCSLGHK